MKKKTFGKDGEPENGALAFYKEDGKWIPYPAKKAPNIAQFGPRPLQGVTDWIINQIMRCDQEEGVKVELWAYDDGDQKHTMMFFEGKVTKEKNGAWVDVKVRLPWIVI
jgi:hypothetical protein